MQGLSLSGCYWTLQPCFPALTCPTQLPLSPHCRSTCGSVTCLWSAGPSLNTPSAHPSLTSLFKSQIKCHLILEDPWSFYKDYIEKIHEGLPWWHSCWESTCQCRGHRFDPWSGKVPHVAEQLGPCATTTEPALWSPWATTTGAHTPRARAPQLERPLQWEARAQQRGVPPPPTTCCN